jgi:hypothetical protein
MDSCPRIDATWCALKIQIINAEATSPTPFMICSYMKKKNNAVLRNQKIAVNKEDCPIKTLASRPVLKSTRRIDALWAADGIRKMM